MFKNRINVSASAVQLHDEFDFAGRRVIITHIAPQRRDKVQIFFRLAKSKTPRYHELILDNDYSLAITRK